MSTFIVAEVGSNYYAGGRDPLRDFDRALALIDAAARAGANAVKFQAFSPGQMYAPDAGRYLGCSVNALLDDLVLPREWLPKLASACADRGVEFMASAFSPADVDAVDPYVKRHKIASYELGYEALIRHAAEKGKPLILSTGAATTEEVDTSIWWAQLDGADITVLHCVAAYPAPIEQSNLRVLCTMQEHMRLCLPVRVGLSDHTFDPVLCPTLAVAAGATVIEKHLTLDRRAEGPDHAFALEPHEFRQMVAAIRTAEAVWGDGNKRPQPCEEPLRRFATRAVQATRDIAAGEPIVEDNAAVLRPGERLRGADARHFRSMLGRRVLAAVRAGDGIRLEDLA